nr:phage minor head protein [Coprococcus comes]
MVDDICWEWEQRCSTEQCSILLELDNISDSTIRIARTEGHRIQNEAALDGQHEAKKKGADIVKQWDSTLDGRTRDEHRECDGQIREIDEPFDVGGEKMQAPGVGGSAKNVCNCRCCLLQRAKWALDEDELEELKERAAFFGLDKSKDFEEFKQKYCQLPEDADTMEVPKGHSEAYESLIRLCFRYPTAISRITERFLKIIFQTVTTIRQSQKNSS